MNYWHDYHLPTTVSEALDVLAHYDGRARAVAGGTDLILDLQDGRRPPVEALVDITRIPALGSIHSVDDWIVVGAAVTHHQIVESRLLRQHAACLAESCGVIGGPQVRNVATIGGNVAHALPAADGTVSLLALDAEGLVASPGPGDEPRQVWRPLVELFLGPGRSAVDSSRELLVAFRFRQQQRGEASAFQRIMRPQGVALPILGVATRVRLTSDAGHFDQVQIAIGPAGPVPFRASAAEVALRGAACDSREAIDQAVAAVRKEARLRTSRYRATAEYRHEMLALLVRRVLAVAVERARRDGLSS